MWRLTHRNNVRSEWLGLRISYIHGLQISVESIRTLFDSKSIARGGLRGLDRGRSRKGRVNHRENRKDGESG